MSDLDYFTKYLMDLKRADIEQDFDSDVFAYYGPIGTWALKPFRTALEAMTKNDEQRKERIAIILHTGGGEVEAVERMVEMIRRWYPEVYFIVPQIAMSAGTIFCMSGDKIFMDYTSALGPIDPQVQEKGGNFVPALGYLDKFNDILEKSKHDELSPVEFAIAQNQDMALLRRYEQARDLSVNLLKQWLVMYKFKDWAMHRSPGPKHGAKVTTAEKEERAQAIAAQLGDNHTWHSHGRMIGIGTLTKALRLEVDDYTDQVERRKKINSYHDVMIDYMRQKQMTVLLHARHTLGV
ncbi:MAG: serine dehydrogenasease [Burkholderiaceae bacterium]|nr:MAG: serine dehydrogenasease [Burkholderiaceae bacterium]